MTKRRGSLLALAVVAAAMLLTGCKTEEDAVLFAQWVFGIAPDTELIDISQTNFNVAGSGIYNGSVSTTVDSIDEDAGHILTTITSATGYYSGWSGMLYWTYKLDGDSLYLNNSFVGFPADAVSGRLFLRF